MIRLTLYLVFLTNKNVPFYFKIRIIVYFILSYSFFTIHLNLDQKKNKKKKKKKKFKSSKLSLIEIYFENFEFK